MRGFAVVLLLCAGCMQSRGGGGGDGDSDADADTDADADADYAVQACRDFGDSLGDWAVSCGGDYSETYDAFLEVVNGDCENVLSVRDREELEGQCFPWIEGLDCVDYTDENFALDSSCVGQLQGEQP